MSHKEFEIGKMNYSIPNVNNEINPSNRQSIKNNPDIQKQTNATIARNSKENKTPIPAIIIPINRNIPAKPRSLPALSKSLLSELIFVIL